MSPSPQLAPPGSSMYSSDTLHVGDGTWDSQRNTFLLPNLMGLNFATMQYNGMGNRFRNFPGYHSLIRGHGVIAAITFLGLVPISILATRFYLRSPHWVMRIHIWAQILTLFLTTVIFVLGWFAVGPNRSLTNPHHGIGLAIYVLVISQVIWGWFVHKGPNKPRPAYLSLKGKLHQWLGWTTALLGLAQIPLGLTLYGSPLSLFVLYALAVFLLLIVYFVLSYVHERRELTSHYDRSSYLTGTEVLDDRSGGGPGGLAAAGAAGLGAAGLGRHFRRRSRSRSPSEGTSRTPYIHEKDREHENRGGWKKKLLQVGGIAAVAGLATRFMNNRRGLESDTESGRYHPAETVTESLEDDHPVRPRGHPLPGPGPYHRRDTPLSSYNGQYTESGYTHGDERSHTARNALFGAGIITAVKGLFRGRAARDEEKRLEEIRRADLESERMMGDRRYTGDGRSPRRNRYPSVSEGTVPSEGDVLNTGRNEPPRPPKHRPELSASDTMTSMSGRTPGPSMAMNEETRPPNPPFTEPHNGSVESPPLSLKVKLGKNGEVTVRKVPGLGKSGRRPREASLSGNEDDEHWRRVEDRERQEALNMQRATMAEATAGPSRPSPASPVSQPEPSLPMGSGLSVPQPPPPIPATGYLSSPLSTDLSGSYASRSGRRRTERRAQSKQGGSRVEFAQ